jgi:RsiW-degrading membrane proteinase PrsW (M82 family)
MGTLIYILFISIFLPLLLMMLLVEEKARLPIAFMMVGIFVSVFASEVNGALLNVLNLSRYDATIMLAPISEELLKALPVLFFALVVSDRKEKLFTASMATGIGFAILENAYYLIINYQTFSFVSALIRGFGTGLMHGMCTLLVGFGISFIRKKRKLFAVGTFALLTTAITYHSIFNMLVQSQYSMIGAVLPLVTYLPFFVWRHFTKKKTVKEQNDASRDQKDDLLMNK